ncbi:uncharacterized protein LOC120282328 isoform X2 [Dioscorea cayenensis subsp. rotundata]|uniref:Uncharacterized protein LOC120282328 isoform X2 n=1 Tax=Dioscorea cayennensis subsp. rotundata TaxID=55577 RepID=A0AB40D486_DIOCR|nr:uncharacterized protein LOC120282328 isoform X2 [Dioscorea cayenensis subsp. rotundata]
MASLVMGGHHCLPSSSSSSSMVNYDIATISRRRKTRMMSGMVTRSSLGPVPLPALLAVAVIFSSSSTSTLDKTLSNIPQTLSSGDDVKQARIQKPKSRKAESCTIKCVTTCIRGGAGSPGEGPLNVRRPLVVFKQGFRSRRYCLAECSDICNLIKDGDDGP